MSRSGVHFALTAAQTEALWDRYEQQDDAGVLVLVAARANQGAHAGRRGRPRS
jgi:hypothetical protein